MATRRPPPRVLFVTICSRPERCGLRIEIACETEKEAETARKMHARDFKCRGARVHRYSLRRGA